MIKRALTATAAAMALVATGTGLASADPVPLPGTGTLRIAGADRFATAVKVSQKTFTSPQPLVFIASGENFPDALAAGPAAAWVGAPILLVRKDSVPTVVKTELARLKPKVIYVIGGTGSVSNGTYSILSRYVPIGGIGRVAGANRYATAEKVVGGWKPTDIDVVYLASGESFADALGGGAAAAAEGAALLLTAKNSLPVETARAIKFLTPKEIVIVGGTGAVSAGVATAVKSATKITPQRIAGANRFATAAALADALWGGDGAKKVFLASGTSFPDALAATPSAAINLAPVLLTTGTCTPRATKDALTSLKPSLTVFLGGTSVTHGGTKVC